MRRNKGIAHWRIYKAKGGSSQEGDFTHHKINMSDKWMMTCYSQTEARRERRRQKMENYTTNEILAILAKLHREVKKACWERYDRLWSNRGIKDEAGGNLLLIQITRAEGKMAAIEAIYKIFENKQEARESAEF